MNPDQTAPKANNVNPDQTAPLGTVLSGFILFAVLATKEHNVCWESKPRNSDFYQNGFLSTREYQMHSTHSFKSLVALDQL